MNFFDELLAGDRPDIYLILRARQLHSKCIPSLDMTPKNLPFKKIFFPQPKIFFEGWNFFNLLGSCLASTVKIKCVTGG